MLANGQCIVGSGEILGIDGDDDHGSSPSRPPARIGGPQIGTAAFSSCRRVVAQVAPAIHLADVQHAGLADRLVEETPIGDAMPDGIGFRR